MAELLDYFKSYLGIYQELQSLQRLTYIPTAAQIDVSVDYFRKYLGGK